MTSTCEDGKVPTLPLIFPLHVPSSDFSTTDITSPTSKLISRSFVSMYLSVAFATAMARVLMSEACGGSRWWPWIAEENEINV